MDSRLAITDQKPEVVDPRRDQSRAAGAGRVAQANKFTDALGAAMAMGAALTAVGAVVAAVVIRGKPKHELSAHGGPELPPPIAL